MAHNAALTRKAKSTRLENPPMSQTYRQQANDVGMPKEKVPKMSNNRRNKSSKQQVQDSPTTQSKAVGQMSHFDLTRASKNPIRAAGGGGAAAVAPKYQSKVNLSNQQSKTLRTPVLSTGRAQKLTPKEIKEFRETEEFKMLNEPKEIRELKEAREFRDFKELKEAKEHKTLHEPKESKEHKESKDSRLRGAPKSPNLSHRNSRHNSNRTKNYFDKYLKFAFDLSTPDGVQKLEAHFFPNQSFEQAPNTTGNLNFRREEPVKPHLNQI
ncbi:uncharacterized protein LOC108042303 [Drosophila rhopaloa]|uniref:Uncharacterized protein LOC108042303 n=1 Tax=Drosophila rhopaloa TaxID=1041015 RepID=A0A6P4ES23_DRORH|nr:uncharacterized protein LOC108042303 [Drosophila rhopaloa]